MKRTMKGRTVAAMIAGTLLATTVLTAVAPGVADAKGPPSTPPGRAGDVLPADLRGESAIQALGDRLPVVAAQNGMTPGEFMRMLRSDNEFWVGRSGQALYVDESLDLGENHPEAADPAIGETTSLPDPVGEDYTVNQAFTLESNPGAARTIILDFNGFDATGTAWDNGTAPGGVIAGPYDADGNPGAFSNTELQNIINIWKTVSEDFAGMDVNVTTVDNAQTADKVRRTSSTDQAYGSRAVITNTQAYNCSCGGVAYVGTFGLTGTRSSGMTNHDFYQPAWVFAHRLGGSWKNVAEATTHEVGHNLGLDHDGATGAAYYTGHNGWAPIMGVAYGNKMGQWSKGEYAGATNNEDDFAVSASNGGVPRPDDHGDTPNLATPLDSGFAGHDGVIGYTIASNAKVDEKDVFTFTTTGGPLELLVEPAATNPNLDIDLTLTGGGAQIAGTPTGNGLGEFINRTLTAGTYFITVAGEGNGNPDTGYSSYGSVGRYELLASWTQDEAVNNPPSPYLDASAVTGTAPLVVDFSTHDTFDVDQNLTGLVLDFGDGTTPYGHAVPESGIAHTYTQPGVYQALLTATDSDGASATFGPIEITVEAPAANTAPEAFPNVEVSQGIAPFTTTLFSESTDAEDGADLTHHWEVDGTEIGFGDTIFNHTFTAPGTYQVDLTVTDSRGLSDTASVIVTATQNRAPTADASADVTQGTAPLAVTFDGAGSTDPDGQELTYRWTFGDGSSSQAVAPTHTYTNPGAYTATLTVSDGATSSSASVQITVEAGNTAPTVDGFADRTSGAAPVTVVFDATGTDADADTLTYTWDFGDGTASDPSVDARATHTYSTPGQFLATVTVTDGIATVSDSVAISVSNPNAGPPAAPTDVTATSATNGTVTLSWVDNATNESGYVIVREEQHPKNGKWVGTTTVATPGANTTSITDQPGSGTYRYLVYATNGDGNSLTVVSDTVTVTTSGGGGDTGGGGGGKGGGKPPRSARG